MAEKTEGEKLYEAMVMRAQLKFWATVEAVLLVFAVVIKYLIS